MYRILSLCLATVVVAHASSYVFTRLTPPDGTVSGFAELNPGIGINNNGVVAARYNGGGGYEAFTYDGTTYAKVDLGAGIFDIAGNISFDYFDFLNSQRARRHQLFLGGQLLRLPRCPQ